MSHGNELPRIIDKSQANIDAAITAIKSCDLPDSIKDFAISCIRLAVWLPKALFEHRSSYPICVNLFSVWGEKTIKNQSKIQRNHLQMVEKAIKLTLKSKKQACLLAQKQLSLPTKPGHGRLAHSAYTNINCHLLNFFRELNHAQILQMH